MDEHAQETQDRISRRRMIKRLGAATAVAWTAPVEHPGNARLCAGNSARPMSGLRAAGGDR